MSSSSRMLRSSSTTRTRALGMARGQMEGELGAQSAFASDRDFAAVLLGDSVREREPEASALMARGEERFEDVGQILGENSLAAVRHRQLDHTGVKTAVDPQLPARGHGAKRIDAEVPQGL